MYRVLYEQTVTSELREGKIVYRVLCDQTVTSELREGKFVYRCARDHWKKKKDPRVDSREVQCTRAFQPDSSISTGGKTRVST